MMIMESGAVAVPPILSVNMTVKLYVPAVVGVPDIMPVDAPRVSPVGSAPADTDQVNGVVPPLVARA